jgi:ribosomal protein L11 methyltransferase
LAEESWLEISLVVDGEQAEAIAEVLSRHVPGGVVIESTAVTANDDDSESHPVGPLRVYAFLPVDDTLEEKRRAIEEGLFYLGRILPMPAPQFRSVQQQDWSQAWKQHYRPIAIGQRLIIVPSWLESPQPERIAVRIDPGMAFGTGTHPTTQLCLELLETCFSGETPGNDVIDVGCGSGILSVAALKLGARHALGVDIDEEAVRVAQENAALNGVAGRFEIAQGSLQEIQSGAFGMRQAPVVLANILAPVIIRLLGEGVAELASPGGILILSGILYEQLGGVTLALEKAGCRLEEVRQMGDWVALKATRAAEKPA